MHDLCAQISTLERKSLPLSTWSSGATALRVERYSVLTIGLLFSSVELAILGGSLISFTKCHGSNDSAHQKLSPQPIGNFDSLGGPVRLLSRRLSVSSVEQTETSASKLVTKRGRTFISEPFPRVDPSEVRRTFHRELGHAVLALPSRAVSLQSRLILTRTRSRSAS
jgi:hypothetical protein